MGKSRPQGVRTMRNLILLSLVIGCGQIAFADDDYSPNVIENWHFGFGLGLSAWGDLADLEDSNGDSFNDVGFVIDMSAHRRVGSGMDRELLFGVDIGGYSTESDIEGLFEDYTQRLIYVTPSVRYRLSKRHRIFGELGAGWYDVDFAEVDCSSGAFLCTDLVVPFDASTLGGFVGLRAYPHPNVYVNLRAHFADFGTVTGTDIAEEKLGGTAITLVAGMSF